MGFFNKEKNRRDASYYRSLGDSRAFIKRREKVLDAIFREIKHRAKNNENYIEITPRTELIENRIKLYDVIVNEKEYFESKGFKFENKNPDNVFLKKIIISW